MFPKLDWQSTFNAAIGLPVYISQTITSPSLLQEAKYLLQKLMSIEFIAIVCPLRDCNNNPLEADHIFISPISSPVSNNYPVLLYVNEIPIINNVVHRYVRILLILIIRMQSMSKACLQFMHVLYWLLSHNTMISCSIQLLKGLWFPSNNF